MKNVLDDNVLNNLSLLNDEDDGENSFLNEVIDIFLDTSPPLFQELYQSISANDERKIQYYAHRLKGLCANIGAVDLQCIFADIENQGAESGEANKIEFNVQNVFKETKVQLQSEWRR
ncbi:MAG: Hpt domain-containing protein [Oligoflexales bacterium]